MPRDHNHSVAPPPGSPAVSRREGDTLVLEFPAHGARGSSGAFLFVAVFTGVGLLGFVQTLGAILAHLFQADSSTPPFSVGEAFKGLLVCGVFVAIGVGIALLTLDGIRRRTTITLTRDNLAIVSTGVFGARRHEWPLAEVAEVFTAPCGGPKGKINRKLQVQTFDGRKRGFLRGREHTEVEWAARLLRSELRMEAVKL